MDISKTNKVSFKKADSKNSKNKFFKIAIPVFSIIGISAAAGVVLWHNKKSKN